MSKTLPSPLDLSPSEMQSVTALKRIRWTGGGGRGDLDGVHAYPRGLRRHDTGSEEEDVREDGVRGGGLVDSGTVVMNNGEELDSRSVIINGKVRVEGPSRQGSRICGSLAAGLPGPFFWQALFL